MKTQILAESQSFQSYSLIMFPLAVSSKHIVGLDMILPFKNNCSESRKTKLSKFWEGNEQC